MKKVYLDYNATTPVDPAVREAMLPYLDDVFGNPSSLHWAGAGARKAVEEAREKVAHFLSCHPREIVFTSGGTESVHLAVKGGIGSNRSHVITSLIEHPSVLETFEGLECAGQIEVTRLGVDENGDIDLDALRGALRPHTSFISIMFANNETGNIFPIKAIGEIARERKILFHTDAVQAMGKLPIDLSRLPVDLLSFSSHKIYGPKGVGALYVRKGMKIERSKGTENVPAIVGFAEAMERVHKDLERESERIKSLRDRLQNQLVACVPGTRIHGNPDHRLANTLNVRFDGVCSETILIALDREGIAVSSGSACASGSLEPSHVLMAMGVSKEEAKGAVRFSLGKWTNDEEIEYVVRRVLEIVERIRV